MYQMCYVHDVPVCGKKYFGGGGHTLNTASLLMYFSSYLCNYTEQKYKCNNFKYYTELQFIEENQSFEIHLLGPNLWISPDWAAMGGPWGA